MATTEVDTNSILSVKRRAVGVEAVQFTGKNAREIIAFVKDRLGDPTWLHTRNGGTWIALHTNSHGYKALKGDYVVVDADGIVRSYSPEEFKKLFLVKG